MESQMENKFGLTKRDMQTIRDIFLQFPEVEKAFIFGSRAKGNYRPGSDIDLAIMDKGVSNLTIRKLYAAFEEGSLPYRVDPAHFPSLTSPEFIAHIQSAGVPFYDRATALQNFTI
jgi:predicted nucleotidyltransferase